MTAWKYRIDVGLLARSKLKQEEIMDILTLWGDKGWELVAFMPSESTSNKLDWWIYKHPKSVAKNI